MFSGACRTTQNNNGNPPKDTEEGTGVETTQRPQDANAPLLQKVIGASTTTHPANRIEICTLIASDVKDLKQVENAIADVKGQDIVNGFIFRSVVPSIQYFGYLGSERVLLSEANAEISITRKPPSGQGNASLDGLMEILNEKCGEKTDRPN